MIVSFFKKNIVTILVVLVAGNIFYFAVRNEVGNYYHGTLKIRSKPSIYDHMSDILFIATDNSPKEISKDTYRKTYHSYRNEESYIFEVNVDGLEKEGVANELDSIAAKIKSDSVLNYIYYKRYAEIDKIVAQYRRFLEVSDSITTFNNGYYDYGLQNNRISIAVNIFNLTNQKNSLIRDFEIYPVTEKNIEFVEATPRKNLVRVNAALLIISIFVSIVITTMRNYNRD